MGPLNLRVYQATPTGPLTSVQPYVVPGGQLITPADRYLQTPLHTIVIVDMPPIQDIMKNLEDQLSPPGDPTETKSSSEEGSSSDTARPPPLALSGRGLPLLFIRSSDGIGYHSGRTLACENVFHNLGPIATAPNPNGDTNWIAAAVAEGLHGWTLRVL